LIIQSLVKPGEYRDSVALMLLARELSALPGVSDVSVVMGTPANKAILQQAGLLDAHAQAASPNDLVIALRAKDDATAREAIGRAQRLLAQKATTMQSGGAARPRTIRSAIRATPGANMAVVSVAGQYATAQAWDALRAGLHMLLFSDHVALADEIALKEYAREHGLLLMGPGAGTAIINGVGLGFANAVPRGNIGIVAAAGTGLQEVSTLIAKAGAGITQAIGVGGRDVSEAVGGIMMLEALKALQADPDTRVIVVVSKSPAANVTEKIVAQVGQSEKPTVLALMVSNNLDLSLRGAIFATKQSPIRGLEIASQKLVLSKAEGTLAMTVGDLREAAAMAVALARGESIDAARKELAAEDRATAAKARALRRKLNARQKYVRGLYSGGTLCEEAMRLWQESLGEVWSNAPLDVCFKLPDSSESKQHTAIDLGEEEFTIGRPHPMIDNTLRVRRLLQEARDPRVAAIVLDVVIGYGAHPDPAAELAPAIVEAKQIAARRHRELIVVASVTGTESDPQVLSRQMDALRRAGAVVMGSNAAAAKFASQLVA
jgi:succinyl-CoA synthetase alpha subunit